MSKVKQFSNTVKSYRELAALILTMPQELMDQPVMFGDVRGDNGREAFPVNEFGTVNDANYINIADEKKIKSGTVMLFT